MPSNNPILSLAPGALELREAPAIDQQSQLHDSGGHVLWPEPRSLRRELPAVLPFSEELLPESLRPYCLDAAERMEIPLDFVAIPTVIGSASVVSRRARIQPKAKDHTWKVTPNLWGGIVAMNGRMKSAAMEVGLRPVRMIEKRWKKKYSELMKEYLKLPKAERGEEPTLKRLLANDATYEVLQEIHAQHPAGLVVSRDELTGWLAQLDQKGREGERGFYLTSWDGSLPYQIDRVGRGSIPLDACCISILGGLQPQKLSTYLVGSLGKASNNDGLVQRQQLLVYPDFCEEYEYIDRLPNSDAAWIVEQIFWDLVERDPDRPIELRFSPEAQDLFVSWHVPFERTVRAGNLGEVLTGHFAKYKSLVPSLALLFELADSFCQSSVPTSVSYEQTKRGIAWSSYLSSHARRIYAPVLQIELERAIKLAERLKEGQLSSSFTLREVYNSGWELLNNVDEARQAATYLMESGWLSCEPLPTTERGGRPSFLYRLNPRVNFKEHLNA